MKTKTKYNQVGKDLYLQLGAMAILLILVISPYILF